MSRYAQVIVDLSADALDRVFTYRVPDGMQIDVGWQVIVPFGARRLEGFVTGMTDACDLPEEKIRDIIDTAQDYPVVLPELARLADWMHARYLCNLVDALRLMIPSQVRTGQVHIKTARMAHLCVDRDAASAYIRANPRAARQADALRRLMDSDAPTAELNASAVKALRDRGLISIYAEQIRRVPMSLQDTGAETDFQLTDAQARAEEAINRAMDGGGGRFLLNGVTGSGKTEVYIHVIRHALQMGKTAIVLVPEIALTPQMVSWFHRRFGDLAAVLHSGLSAGERYDEWRRIRFGEARVVVGARSAIFAPAENIGVIIVDEEHENTYQSENRPRYDAREVAWHRVAENKAALVLGSATPSIQSFMRAMPGVRPENRLTLLEMPSRINGKPLPEVELVDMRGEFERGNHSVLSAKLLTALQNTLAEGRQAMLFINRRGHSTFVSCRKCGHVIKCESCDVAMTYHQAENLLKCHYCGATMPPPTKCPACGSKYIKYFGAGTQKVAEEVTKLIPMARVARMDVDTTREKNAHEKILNRFRSGDANVLVGTQMIAKGLDFPNVALVGVVAADMTLNLPDYRSVERTFQLITQVAGRAGRADVPGRVIVQTYNPDHYGIRLAAAQDFRAFYQQESAFRKSALYPPYTQIVRIVYSGAGKDAVRAAAEKDAAELNQWIDANGMRRDIVHLRATEAPIKLLRGEYRWHLFLKMYFKGDLDAVCRKMQAMAENAEEGVRAAMEVNPNNMY